ncbi:hypothetical protein [Nonomuraea sp. NPDC005501]|uniref:hypothetical protein n=1 Tax=Nonomuraea sp. NPDC005501 TaxID=3156884 RepID=UPI0033A3AF7D
MDGSRPPVPADFEERMRELVATGRRSDAVRSFMRAGVGLPAVMVAMMRLMPAWSGLKAVAHTLPYDLALAARYQRGEPIPAGTWAGVTVPTLVIDGGKSPAWMRDGVRAVAGTPPAARRPPPHLGGADPPRQGRRSGARPRRVLRPAHRTRSPACRPHAGEARPGESSPVEWA